MFGTTGPAITERDVLQALKGVKDPDLGRDLVDLGMIRDIRIGDGTVSLTVNLTTPACPLKGKIEGDVRGALQSRLPGGYQIQIHMAAEVRGKGITEKGDVPGIKNVIAVGSGKGGVGKSTMAAAIAYGLRSYGASVGLMDADVYGPSIPHLVGASGRPMARGERIQPIETNGLKLMSMGFLLEPDKAVIMRGPMLHGIMQQFLRQVDWGPLDYLVIDLPPGTGDVPLSLSQTVKAAGVVLVSTPQDVALSDVVKARAMFDKVSVPVLGIVENMSDFVCPHCGEHTPVFSTGGVERAAKAMGIPLLGRIPLDLSIRTGGDEGRPVTSAHPDSPQARAFREMARLVAGRVSVQAVQVKLPVFSTAS